MPLVRIAVRKGKPAGYRMAIMHGVYRAMIEAFAVPENDRFMLLDEYEAENFSYDAGYLDIARSDDLVMIQITANDTRSTEQKQAFYARVAELLGEKPGIRPEDVLISLVEVKKENWSFGRGIAQYV